VNLVLERISLAEAPVASKLADLSMPAVGVSSLSFEQFKNKPMVSNIISIRNFFIANLIFLQDKITYKIQR
jgi:hypothetical protein